MIHKQYTDMHNVNHDEFNHKIVQINSVEYVGNQIKAVITTNHLGRITTKPYSF